MEAVQEDEDGVKLNRERETFSSVEDEEAAKTAGEEVRRTRKKKNKVKEELPPPAKRKTNVEEEEDEDVAEAPEEDPELKRKKNKNKNKLKEELPSPAKGKINVEEEEDVAEAPEEDPELKRKKKKKKKKKNKNKVNEELPSPAKRKTNVEEEDEDVAEDPEEDPGLKRKKKKNNNINNKVKEELPSPAKRKTNVEEEEDVAEAPEEDPELKRKKKNKKKVNEELPSPAKRKTNVEDEDVAEAPEEYLELKKKRKREEEPEQQDDVAVVVSELLLDKEIKKKKKRKKEEENNTSVASEETDPLELNQSSSSRKKEKKQTRREEEEEREDPVDISPACLEERGGADDGVDDLNQGESDSNDDETAPQQPSSQLRKLLLEEDIFQVMDKVEGTADAAAVGLNSKDVGCEEDGDPAFLMDNFYPAPELDDGPDFVSRAFRWILDSDFSLPRLNRSWRRHFWSLSAEEAQKVKERHPRFKASRFTAAEDLVLIKRLQDLMKEVELTPEETLNLIKEVAGYSKRSGGNKLYCRLILGAYLGRPMLTYRRAIDCFHRIRALAFKKVAAVVDVSTVEKVVNFLDDKNAAGKRISSVALLQCRTQLGMPESVENRDVSEIYRSNKGPKRKMRRGRYSDEEISTLIYLVVKQLRSSSSNSENVSEKDLCWQSLADEMQRSVESLMKIWKGRIYPVLTTHQAAQDVEDGSWRARLVRLILADPDMTERRQIDWVSVRKQFPYQTQYSLGQELDNVVLGAQRKTGSTFREALERGLQYLLNDQKRTKKDNQFVALFEDARIRLLHEDTEEQKEEGTEQNEREET